MKRRKKIIIMTSEETPTQEPPEKKPQKLIFLVTPLIGIKKPTQKEEKIHQKIKQDIKNQGYDLITYPIMIGTHFTTKNTTLTIRGKIGKGYGVRNALQIAKKITQLKNCQTSFICCDGTNKIPLKNIPRLIKALQKYDCVMAERGKEKAISKQRHQIERFEIFLLSKTINDPTINNMDGQCGLWGFNLPQCSHYELNAEGYGIELNIVKEAHKKPGTKIGLLPVKVQKGKTQFKHNYTKNSSHYQKLNWIKKTFNLTTKQILQHAKEYPKQLPPKYLKLIKKLPNPEYTHAPKKLLKNY